MSISRTVDIQPGNVANVLPGAVAVVEEGTKVAFGDRRFVVTIDMRTSTPVLREFNSFADLSVAGEMVDFVGNFGPTPTSKGDGLLFKYALTHPYAKPPEKKHVGDAGWDLYTCERTEAKPRGYTEVRTGVCIEMPEGVWGRLTGRSSTSREFGLQVQEGIIDNGYIGELFAGVWNASDTPVIIPQGVRIAQVIFAPLVQGVMYQISEKSLKSRDGRGINGFGSTGK